MSGRMLLGANGPQEVSTEGAGAAHHAPGQVLLRSPAPLSVLACDCP